MALKIMQLIRSTLLTFTVLTSLHLSIGQQTNLLTEVWNGDSCGSSQYTNGSVFHVSLMKVLESLAVNVSTTGFDTSVAGQNSSNSVYGLRQCRGDLSSSDCHQCASTIKQMLLEKCQNSTSGFIQLVGCFLRYDTHYFYNYSEGIQTYAAACNKDVGDQPETFASAVLKVLSNITERAVWNPNLFAADAFQADSSSSRLIYGLAQCWRDLSKASCQSCLSFALSNVTAEAIYSLGCANGSTGAQWYAMGCQLRYEVYLFYNSPPPPSPPLSEGRKLNVLAITLGAVAASVGLIAAICLFRFRPKRWERISRTRGEGGEISSSVEIVISTAVTAEQSRGI